MWNKSMQVILVLILLAAAAAPAACRRGPQMRAQSIVDSIVRKLDLNNAQKTKLNGMREEFQAKLPGMKKTREETFDQMIAMMRSQQMDPLAVNRLADRNRAQADDLIGFIFSRFMEFHDMLTPQQREKAAQEMERWREQYRKQAEGETLS